MNKSMTIPGFMTFGNDGAPSPGNHEIIKPSATRNLFEKRFLDFQKLLVNSTAALIILLAVIFAAPAPAKSIPYKNIFPNIDLNIFVAENYSQYQWKIKPGGDVQTIRFENQTTVSPGPGHWVFQKPLASQVIDGHSVNVDVALVSTGNRFGFNVGNYNKNADLIIRCDAERCFGDPPAVTGNISTPVHHSIPFSGTTYYIRTDGGTAAQCTGTSDAPYPGSGSNQPCAWSHPFWALDDSGQWKIQGGDTMIIAAGSYKMGYGAPNTGWCDAEGAYGCVLPPLPSGPTAGNPTRILGKGWDSDCPNAPELWGSQRPWQIIDLTGSSNVYIGCLEITDHSSCVESHANPAVECQRDSYPYGDWAPDGIHASDSSNVTLKYLDIHGLASTGIRAGRISDWTVEDVRVAGNGWAGWDGDLSDENDSNSGTLTFKRFTIEWNGCGETYPGGQPHNCWSQTAGGYGDGFGTGTTAGHWIFEDSIFRYNTSDGLDLLYARNSGSQIDIKRTMAYGNAGNAIKVNGPTAIENTLMVGNCGFFHGKSFTYNVDDCRALGSPLSFSLRKGSTFSLVNSTIVGQGDCLMGGECDENSSCDGSEKIIIQNNAFQGYQDYLDPSDTTCYLWLDRFDFYDLRMDYNILYQVKIADQLSLSAHEIQKDPLFVNDSLGSFDGHLQAGSPAINTGLPVGSLSGLIPADDLEANSRPRGPGVDRGAYEYQSGITTPTITVISPNGGENWVAGSVHAISWSSTGTVGNVKIQYSTNNGTSWSTITSSTANDGSYSWTVPQVSSTRCLVKVSESDGSPTDTGNAVFTITMGGPQPGIQLNRTQLTFGTLFKTRTDAQTFRVSNSGGGTLNWTASSDKSWLSCYPTSGTDSGVVVVTVTPISGMSGTAAGTITITAVDASNSPQMVQVTLNGYTIGGSAPPFGSFDTPTEGAVVYSSIPVTGWALDDVQVSDVKIYREENGALVYIGDALFVEGARPDIEQSYPDYPFNYEAGWGYMMLTNFLPNQGNGTFTLHAIAYAEEGQTVTLGTKTIICDNANAIKPFGAIDTPAQGGIASGANFKNWGWALTPQPNSIPIDGSTIGVYVDGVNLGHPVYNLYRPDVAGLFPGYANAGGAGGYFTLDTTAYSNGVHSIFWTAADNAGNIDGIGSRYFTIQNLSGSLAKKKAYNKCTGASQNYKKFLEVQELFYQKGSWPPEALLFFQKGYNPGSEIETLYPDENGQYTIEIKELERLVIYLENGETEGDSDSGEYKKQTEPPKGIPEEGRGEPRVHPIFSNRHLTLNTQHSTLKNTPSYHYEGYIVNGDDLKPLPIGSTLDRSRGVFYWQPGPGFLGEYRLAFIEEGETGILIKRDLRIKIIPKF